MPQLGPLVPFRRLLSLALLLLLAVAAPAQADERPSRDAQTAALLQLLRAPHPQVDGPALARLGPDVHAILIEQATAAGAEVAIRQRALAWLQYFPTTASRAVLMEALRARGASVGTVRVVLRALAIGFGVDALPVLSEHLLHKNVYIREASAFALGDLDDRRVPAILEDQLARESELAVRDAIEASLQRIAKRRR
ncbi:MAG: hypothetical protein HY902_14370 [Deltaproteobacteria bacterium]|nr:hypothetical protein [Deltaproteobacteria bacterium]